jgi:hypothetical protein
MKRTNFISRLFSPAIFIFLSGCSTTYKVSSTASGKDYTIITKEEFIKRIGGNNVTIVPKTGQSKKGKIVSVQDDCIFFIDGQDTTRMPVQDIQCISDKHWLTGALIGFPSGAVLEGNEEQLT